MSKLAQISPEEASRRIQSPQPPRIIDVREPEEWDIFHLPGAELLPLSTWPEAAETLTRFDEPLLMVCHHGVRSEHAAEFLLARGFTDVTNLAGGLHAWALQVDPTMAC